MRERQQPRSDWAHLSNELWIVIFMLVSEGCNWPPMMPLYRLPLVCQRFRGIFLQQPHLCDHFIIHQAASSSLPSVILWIQRYGRHVKECSLYTMQNCHAVLAALLAHSVPLHMLELTSASGVPFLIAAFSGLTTCKLKSSYDQSALDLQPLQALQNLQNLELEIGQFTNLQVAAVHLTRLHLNTCSAECTAECLCVTSLMQLQLERATLTDFHRMGLAACCCLQHLRCEDSDVGALLDSENLYLSRNEPPTVPASLTALVCLTSLQVSFASCSVAEVTFDWLTCLTALQCIEALVMTPRLVLPSSFSTLSSIRKLSIVAQVSEEGYCIKLMFDWKCLMLLEKLSLGGKIVACEEYSLSDLTSLTKLWHVSFWDCCDLDQLTRRQLAELSYNLGKTRPDVAYIVEQKLLQASQLARRVTK